MVFHLDNIRLILIRHLNKSTSATVIATPGEMCLTWDWNREQVHTEWDNGTDHSKLQCSESTEVLKVQIQACACVGFQGRCFPRWAMRNKTPDHSFLSIFQ